MKCRYLFLSLVPLLVHAANDEFDLDQIPYFQPKTVKAAEAEPVAEADLGPVKDEKKNAKPQSQDKRKAKVAPKAAPGAKPSQQRPVLKTTPTLTVQASKPQSEPKKAQPQGTVVPKKPKKTVEADKPDGSKFSNKYGPFKKTQSSEKTPRENPKFSQKYKLEIED
jgi:hypothetical protein